MSAYHFSGTFMYEYHTSPISSSFLAVIDGDPGATLDFKKWSLTGDNRKVR
jgi:hypothetical protein